MYKDVSNRNKSEQLGISFGSAVHQLRKSIMFHLLQKLGENICFVCSTPINRVDELSIEHKIPWQNNDTALFWDIDNIAFSHLRCNKTHSYPESIRRRRIGPEGTSYCVFCKDFLPIDQFQKNRSKWDGVQDFCKEHAKMLKLRAKRAE